MEVLKIKLQSNVANYKKGETIENKMTYPLPPFSTVIGAIHKACGYTEYHPMDISIQGSFTSMKKQAFTSHMFLNSVQNDRDTLVKMRGNNILSNSFDKVITSVVSQGANLKENINSKVLNQDLYEEYLGILDKKQTFESEEKTIYKPKIKELKDKVKELKSELKNTDNTKIEEIENLKSKIDELDNERKEIEQTRKIYKEEHITIPLSMYRTFNSSLKSYELLHDIDLCLHVSSNEETLVEIEKNIYNITAIGRSEDFVEVVEVKRVNLTKDFAEAESNNSHYLDYKEIDLTVDLSIKKGIEANGTVYYLPKDYTLEDNKRVFNKKKVLYCSKFTAYGESDGNIYIDEDGELVSLL